VQVSGSRNNSIGIVPAGEVAIRFMFLKKYFAKHLASSETFRIFAVSSREDKGN